MGRAEEFVNVSSFIFHSFEESVALICAKTCRPGLDVTSFRVVEEFELQPSQ